MTGTTTSTSGNSNSNSNSNNNKDDKTAGRVLLPSYVQPQKYDLVVTPNLTAYSFDGIVAIEFLTGDSMNEQESKRIKLHSKELMYRSAEFQTEAGTVVKAEEIRVNMKETTVTFLFPESIPPSSTITLTIDFAGCLNNQMAGFYRSTYKDNDGTQKIVASTQFEALDARRAFPCVDEPSAKATFILTLVVPSHLQCFSNMPVSMRKTLDEGTVQVSFLETPRMSTYLLAYCIGEFDSVQGMTNDGVLIQVYALKGKSASCQYALECGCKALDSFNEFFGIKYPLPKLDMVAIPEFAAGAMENWGLVTYRDVDLLIDPETASNSQKQRVCTVVCHELAHQWFGNLVTMAWWDDLWLNEGFASWAENYASHVIHPEYQMWDQFCSGALQSCLVMDAMVSSHPIQVPIAHAEEVEQVFDAISYCKGGSVVRMIQAVIGMAAFREGLGNYMAKHAYGNTETIDLWKAWEDASKMPICEMMASWTEQMGCPLLKVVGEDWQDDKVVLTLEQSWFLSDGSEVPVKDKLWTIPILSCTSEGTQPDMVLMREKTATITIPIKSKSDWIKLNAGQEVPMRVHYSEELWTRLSKAVANSEVSSPSDRVGLILDAYALVKANQILSPKSLMQLLAAYKDESDYVVWGGIKSALGGLDAVLSGDETIYSKFTKFARTLVLPLFDKVGWDARPDDGHLTSLLRGLMVGLLSGFCFDDAEVAKEAKMKCEAFFEDPTNSTVLSPDIKANAFRIYLKNGGKNEYDTVKAYYSVAKDNAERKLVLNTLGEISDRKLKLETLDWTTSGAIKLQDFFYAIGSVSGSGPKGRAIAWEYFQEHHERIQGMVATASPSLMDACITYSCGRFVTLEKAAAVEDFFEKHKYPRNERRILQMIEAMRANGKLLVNLQQTRELSSTEFWDEL